MYQLIALLISCLRHGLADQLIFPNGSSSYYERVLKLDPKAKDFYRYFEAPGVAHCMGGPGAFPATVFDELVAWVEKGNAPDQLEASTAPVDEAEAVRYRPLCLYPQVAAYQGGHPNLASSFKCADRFGKKKAPLPDHSEL